MPETSNFSGGMSVMVLGPMFGILNRFSSVKTEANWSLNFSAFCSLFTISVSPDFRVPTPRLSFLVDLMYDQNLLLILGGLAKRSGKRPASIVSVIGR